jgi:phosphatidylglycerol---prolipoprotein diacylglyceryl transferase
MYGLLIATGALVALLISEKLVKKEGRDPDILWGLAFWTLLAGVAGARLYHVASVWTYYSENLLLVPQIWLGGLGIWGGLAGGVAASTIYLRTKKERFLGWINIIAVSVPLAQAIGRLGNYFNHEIYGSPTKLPWGIYSEKVHPLFLYESVLNLALFAILLKRYGRGSKTILYEYLAGYAIIRFFLEFLRVNPQEIWEISGLNIAQVISILTLGISVYFINKSCQK